MKSFEEKMVKFIATCGGAGYSAIAPGTVGTFVAYAVFLVFFYTFSYSYSYVYLVATIFLFFLGVYASTKAEAYFGHDGSPIVIDEFVGFFVSTLFLPLHEMPLWMWGFFAFLIFRFFDILKPGPINKMQEFKQGWGIMLDDLLAGIFTNFVLQFLLRFMGRGAIA